MRSFSFFFDGDRIEVDIPFGFYFKEGEVDKGLVIEDKDGNQYVRIPSGYTADGVYVRGFWVSGYEISIDEEGNACSVAGCYPVIKINYYDAMQLAKSRNGELLTREEYNRICMWLVQTKAATFENVFVTGNGMGNYSKPFTMAKTGSNPAWMCNHIDNFFGNCYIWTTERSEINRHFRIIRGGAGTILGTGNNYPASCRTWAKPESKSNNVTIRIALHDAIEDDEED